MARSKTKAKVRRTPAGRASARGVRSGRGSGHDAIALLKADHRQVEAWFAQFQKTRSTDRKSNLAAKICQALKVHTEIEEEIFYPAFLEVTSDRDTHHEAVVEHAGAKKLIAEIEAGGPEDDYFDAKVTVLSEMIKHHVKEEEGPGGMFAEAKKSEMDLQDLGAQLKSRKNALMAEEARPRRAGDGRGRARDRAAEPRAAAVV